MKKKPKSKPDELGLCEWCAANTYRVEKQGRGGCPPIRLCAYCWGESEEWDRTVQTDKVPPDQ